MLDQYFQFSNMVSQMIPYNLMKRIGIIKNWICYKISNLIFSEFSKIFRLFLGQKNQNDK